MPEGRPAQRKSSVVRLSVEPARLTEISGTGSRASKGGVGKKSSSKGRMGAGSGSEGEATGGEGGEAGRRPKIKLRLNGSPTGGSPVGSRAGSPNPGQTGGVASSGSRAGSPTATAAGGRGRSPPAPAATSSSAGNGERAGARRGDGADGETAAPITDEELVASIPPEGRTIQELLAVLPRKRVNAMPAGAFAAMIKRHAARGPDKKLRLRSALREGGGGGDGGGGGGGGAAATAAASPAGST